AGRDAPRSSAPPRWTGCRGAGPPARCGSTSTPHGARSTRRWRRSSGTCAARCAVSANASVS
ncbi:MAG: hypothetical protein AVDCRST_MAG11-3143, partial [uncultured Gemmatimonadaceae bacterium]